MKNGLRRRCFFLCTGILFFYLLLGSFLLYGQVMKEKVQAMAEWVVSLKLMVAPTTQSASRGMEAGVPPPPLNRLLSPTYEVDAVLDSKAMNIEGNVNIQFLNPGRNDLLFYLYEYPDLPFQIRSITFQGKKLDFKRSTRMLSLENPAGESVDQIGLVIEFTVPVPPQGTRFGVKDKVWLLTNWYPQLAVLSSNGEWLIPPAPVGYGDPFYYQYGDYTIRLLSHPSIRWLSSGERVTEEMTESGQLLITWKAEQILTFAMAGSPHYRIETVPIDNRTTMDIALVDQGKMSEVLDLAKRAAMYYRQSIGPLPYKKVSLVETSFGTNFAMEYPNLAVFSRDMYRGNQIRHWIPHEIAHFWWFNAVGTLEPDFGWIDEGFSEFSYLSFLRLGSDESEVKEMNRYNSDWETLQRQYPQGHLNKGLVRFDTKKEWSWSLYSKSVIVLQQLYKQMGSEDFRRFVVRVQQDHTRKIIGPEHLDFSLGKVLGQETDFFRKNADAPHQIGIIQLMD